MSANFENARVKLLNLKEELETRISKIEQDLQDPPQELSEHWDDQAILVSQNEVRQNLLVEAKQEMVQINEALGRINNGTYGECKVCAQSINPKRLEAVPFATLCMEHAS